MIQRQEELRNIKSQDTCRKVSYPPHANEVGKHNVHIRSRFELETTKLALMNEVVRDHVELKSITDNFFDEFTQCVQQHDGFE